MLMYVSSMYSISMECNENTTILFNTLNPWNSSHSMKICPSYSVNVLMFVFFFYMELFHVMP
jgi:hypothetical protein